MPSSESTLPSLVDDQVVDVRAAGEVAPPLTLRTPARARHSAAPREGDHRRQDHVLEEIGGRTAGAPPHHVAVSAGVEFEGDARGADGETLALRGSRAR